MEGAKLIWKSQLILHCQTEIQLNLVHCIIEILCKMSIFKLCKLLEAFYNIMIPIKKSLHTDLEPILTVEYLIALLLMETSLNLNAMALREWLQRIRIP